MSGWTESVFDLDGSRVAVSVKRLTAEERERMAMEIAWFADGMTHGVDLRTTAWPALLGRILSRYVAITLDETGREGNQPFWDKVVCRTFEVFMNTNQLAPILRRRLQETPTRM